MDFILLNMPYASPLRPSLALGLLQSVLNRGGIGTRSIYANLEFIEALGLQEYNLVSLPPSHFALCEWTFAHIAFPGFEPNHDNYFEKLMKYMPLYRRFDFDQFKGKMFSVREEASRFIDSLAERILEEDPCMVGCSSTLDQHIPSLAILRKIHELAPDKITLLGGANCETIMGRTTHLSFPWVDYVVSGEAEDVIIDLAKDILEYGREIEPDRFPSGVFVPLHRSSGYPDSGNGGSYANLRLTSSSFSDYPIPDYDDYFSALNSKPSLEHMLNPALTFEASRGCQWNRCTFCGLNGELMKYRRKNSDQVIGEFRSLCQRYGIDRIEAVDNMLGAQLMKSLIPKLINEKTPYRIFFEIRADLKRYQIKKLRDAGIIWVQAGIESLQQDVLRLMNKGTKVWQNIQLLKWCRQYGIRISWKIMHNFPREKDEWYEEMADLLPLITHLQPPSSTIPLRYDRYSQYHERQEDFSLRLRPFEMYRFTYPLTDEELNDQVYFFEDEEEQELMQNPMLACLLAPTREGFKKMRRAVYEWINLFSKQKLPVLTMRKNGSVLQIKDTRPIAFAPSFELSGLKKELYLRCDEAMSTPELYSECRNHGNQTQEIDAAIRELVENKLMIEIDDRLLSLAVEEPMMEIPELEDFPGGSYKNRSDLKCLDIKLS